MADTGKKGKKKKGKGKTINLSEFLSGGSGGTGSSFASKKTIDIEENEPTINDDWEEEPKKEVFDLSRLPTAPRSSRSTVDAKALPTQPPYTAFLGNLAYDVEEEDIHDFFAELQLEKVRLPRENGRLRGFGYAEFCDVESLAQAIKLNNESLKGRNMRVDIADHSGGGDGQGRDESREDRSSDWRRREAPGFSGEPERRTFDRSSRDDMGRGDRRDDRDPSEADNASTWRRGSPLQPAAPDQGRSQGMRSQGSRPPGDSEADSASTWRKNPSEWAEESQKPFGRDSERTGYDGDRGGYGRERGGYDRERGGYDRERAGFDRERGGFDRERAGFDRERGGFDRERGGFDRERGGFDRERGRFDRDRTANDKESDTVSSWRNEANSTRGPEPRDNFTRDMGRSYEETDKRESQEAPKERPKLNLKPRTVEAPKQESGASSSSIFGGARPVDTASKEKQIEQKLIQEKFHKDRVPRGHGESKGNEKPLEDEQEVDGENKDSEYQMKKDRTRVMRPDFSAEQPIARNDGESSPKRREEHGESPDKERKDADRKEKSRDQEHSVAPPRAYEEPKAPVFSQKSVFSVLANEDDDDDVDSGNEED